MANKLTFSSEDEESDGVEEMDTTAIVTIYDKGKRPMEMTKSSVVDKKAKNPRLVKEPFLQVVEYPTPILTVDEGKTIDTKKSLVKHYNYLNNQAIR